MLVSEDAEKEVSEMCEHDFRLGADGQVTCVKCFVLDDEMELPTRELLPETTETKMPDFWATQVSFEE